MVIQNNTQINWIKSLAYQIINWTVEKIQQKTKTNPSMSMIYKMFILSNYEYDSFLMSHHQGSWNLLCKVIQIKLDDLA